MEILFADDHGLVREGIRPFLETLDSEVNVLEAANLQEAIRLASESDSLDLAILDLHMPGMDGLEGIRKLAAECPDVPIVILSGDVGKREVLKAIEYGASGYLPKTLSGKSLLSALRLVLTGETYVPASVFVNDDEMREGPTTPLRQSVPPDNPLSKLSKREWEVLGHLINGKTNKEIGRELDLQEITIKIHVRNAYRKMGATNRADAVRIALKNGWDDLS